MFAGDMFLPAALMIVLLAVDDCHVAVLVDRGDVAGVHQPSASTACASFPDPAVALHHDGARQQLAVVEQLQLDARIALPTVR